jgi:hypothetical protein
MARVAVLRRCTQTEKGRSRVRSRPLTWVELRGFEPLTPSMRTEHAGRQSARSEAFAHVRALLDKRLAASDRALPGLRGHRRSQFAPIDRAQTRWLWACGDVSCLITQQWRQTCR